MQKHQSDLPHPVAVFNTPLIPTNYEEASRWIYTQASVTHAARVVDFTNTHIVTMRALEEDFELATMDIDYFIPDSMPLVWMINWLGGNMPDRVYGPKFTEHCLQHSPPHIAHYFLGGSQSCLKNLEKNIKSKNPELRIVGMRNGYFAADEENAIIEEIQCHAPDCIWLGLGTPKQQAFARNLKEALPSGIILLVGFAFDVNAGTKADAPLILQRAGLTWLFRLTSEPKRLLPRYLKFNSLFLFLIFESVLKNILLACLSRFAWSAVLAYLVQFFVVVVLTSGLVAKGGIILASVLSIFLAFTAAVFAMSVRDAVGGHNRVACLFFDTIAELCVISAYLAPFLTFLLVKVIDG